ncbi:MAG: LPS assembly lipoprotein LptE [Myxococcota bacterium]
MLLAAGGCAYAFTYGGGSPEHDTPSIFVSPLTDRTAEGIAGAMVTERLRQRLGHPLPSSKTDFRLEGDIVAIEGGNIPVFRPGGTAAGLSVLRVRGKARLRDANGNVIWESGDRTGSAELVVADSVSQTEDMRRLALERACVALADELADAVLAR